jgi:hypothetical protein
VTYSPDHVTDARHLTALLDTLNQDVSELRHYLDIYDAVVDLPRPRPPADSDGRQATHDPGRPTETIALDEGRAALRTALKAGVPWIAQACALVRGTTAGMDRALGDWDGTVTEGIMGRVQHGADHGAADDSAGADGPC